MDLSKLTVTPVARDEEPRFRALMDEHHYLGAPSKIGQTVWYAADDGSGEWPALAAFSAAALKCGARDAWIGWSRREQFGRLHLIANNVRLLLRGRQPNLGSRFLALCARRISADWQARHRHPLLLLEALALDCYSKLRNGSFMEKAIKIRGLLERTVFLSAPLRRARQA